jgi:hypothetical protein
MQEAIGENYTIVAEGRNESFTEPKKAEGGFGFNTKETPRSTSTKTSVENLYQNTTQVVTDNNKEQEASREDENKTQTINTNNIIEAVNKGGIEAFKEVLDVEGVVNTVSEVLNNAKDVASSIFDAAKEIYKSSKSSQINILDRLSASSIQVVENITSFTTWKKSENKTFRSFEVTRLIHEKAEKSIEEFQA